MITNILDLIVSHISTVMPEAECRRSWALRLDAAQVDDSSRPTVSVVFADDKITNISDGDREIRVRAVLIVQKKIDPKNMNKAVDPLIGLMERLRDEFMSPVLIESEMLCATCRVLADENEAALYDPVRLLKRNEFVGEVVIEAITTVGRA